MKNRKPLFSLLLFFCALIVYSQTENYKILNKVNEELLYDVNIVFLKNLDTIKVFNNDKDGIFNISSIKDYDKICFSHVSFIKVCIEKQNLKNYNNVIYLWPKTVSLDEVVLNQKQKQRLNINPLPYHVNLSHNTKIANLIKPNKLDIKDSLSLTKIRRIKIKLIDLYGAKNLKYLPFRLKLFTTDDNYYLPDQLLYDFGILRNDYNKNNWFTLDVENLDISVPKKGVFIVFETLDDADYPQQFISTREGIISAVPSVSTKRKRNEKHKSFIYNSNKLEWILQKNFYFQMYLE
ncbi:hypothetical protein M0M57_00035 [Flavobacterium azooxidireducens]|uniref:Carboxypeptidase regulatory-like domain-containing protein n=1 Tax=Flavobacterium azooxidireducens TaxID=1871076 RepID=A0ABY4KEM7_9FLAO|nr:hypothetical protein [Flavobacterium azooxidireducens]UPQ79246.1 hypothetical protein M0M57_00035 [Flavobacterium azooxidireducens]